MALTKSMVFEVIYLNLNLNQRLTKSLVIMKLMIVLIDSKERTSIVFCYLKGRGTPIIGKGFRFDRFDDSFRFESIDWFNIELKPNLR